MRHADVLGEDQAAYSADSAFSKDLFDCGIEGRVTENVANDDLATVVVSGFLDVEKFFFGGANGLFKQNIILCIEKCHCGGIMRTVHGGVDDDIAYDACFDEGFYAVKSELFGEGIANASGFFFERNVVNDSNDFHIVGIAERIVGINTASVSATEKGNFDLFHD